MMKLLRLKLERLLPFLNVPKLETPPDHPGVRTGAIPAEALQPRASYSHLELRGTNLAEKDLSDLKLFRAALDNAAFRNVKLEGARFTHSRIKDCKFKDCSFERSHFSIVDAEGTHLRDCTLKAIEWSGASLRDGHLEGVDLSGAHITLSDFFSARFRDVKARSACMTGVDLSFASLENVDFSNADLRGCTLSFALFQNVKLDGARVEDADLRGVRGLTRESRTDLRRRGALLRTGWIERPVGALLEKLRPNLDPEKIDTHCRRISMGIKFAIFLIVAAVTGQLFWSGALAPRRHDGGSEPAGYSGALSDPTAEEVTRTRENLDKLRTAIQAAYKTSGQYGIARYPTIEDLANNEFDRDGFGPSDDKLPLMAGGVPPNFLTSGEGIVPYCNDPPTQQTLTGDNSDWHYCEATGRVFACGGFTTADTLDW